MAYETTIAMGWGELAAAAATAAGLAVVAASVVRKPLRRVLSVVCGSDVAAEFWTAFWLVLIVVGPLTLTMAGADVATSGVDLARRTVTLVGVGLVVGFGAMGFAVWTSVPRQVRKTAMQARLTEMDRTPHEGTPT